eukprot:CAMPEP_0202471664 /NCGR_PEP_ID=MMETSP1360-20130828/85414_1 /ASSEMBLY_ACC=CAM_ASM_000848 /TAXON_ID=515479 /ORGANISM="Licmophora paradoxa, Strain CCMP2313" /LENGTH=98 /DNA_ID=CAMNT_0049097851 /DNA_START=81 /DNA_END=377 /DNA_ORIENTATION=-
MTQERINALEEIGFVWNALDARWEQSFEELRDYVQRNRLPGKVPPKNETTLRNWILYNTKRFKKLKNIGDDDEDNAKRNKERLKKLQSLGFCMNIRYN